MNLSINQNTKPSDNNKPATTKTFVQLTEENPCEGCPAPCCKMQVHAYKTPDDLMKVDYIRFSLLFPDKELAIDSTGQFSWIEWKTCVLLDCKKSTCTVHKTSKQPLTCVHFNPHNCWYKRNFVTGENLTTDLCRLNSKRFEKWVEKLVFDDKNMVISSPNFEEIQELVKDIPINPILKMNQTLKKGIINI